MYQVYCDDTLIYDDNIRNLKIFAAEIENEINKPGTFTFTIYTEHPYYDLIKRLKTIIRVYQGSYLLFRGRPLDDEIGFHNEKIIHCEGQMAFLVDSIQRPFSYTGTVTGLFLQIMALHNAQVGEGQKIKAGNCDIAEEITINEQEYQNTLNILETRILEPLGAFAVFRLENDGVYMDLKTEINLLSPQKVEFAKNLIDLQRKRQGDEIATALIPLGAKIIDEQGQETEERLTIKSVNDNVDYISNPDAVALYGWIFKTEIWEDVTLASNLLTKARAYLGNISNLLESIELTAADLATVNSTVESFHVGTKVRVTSNPHALDQLFTVNKIKINIMNPGANTLTLGKTISTFTASAVGIKGEKGDQGIRGQAGPQGQTGPQGDTGQPGKDAAIQSPTEPADRSYMWLDTSSEPAILKRYNTAAGQWEIVSDTEALADTIIMLEESLNSQISQTSNEILTQVSEDYYLKSDADALVTSIGTEFSQTNEEFEFRFNEFSADIAAVAAGTDAQFQEISSYIRFVDGNIILGQEDSPLTLKIENDRISFLQENAEVAYFSNNKLYVTDGQFINSLQLGDFTFIPRSNGNLSFKKVAVSNTANITGLALVGAAVAG